MSSEITEEPSDSTNNRYKITICQDGRFAITFDTVNLRIRILENTDHRPFKSKNYKDSSPDHSKSDKIDKTIAHFKINHDLTIKEFYDPKIGIKSDGVLNNDSSNLSSTTKGEDKFRWSFDISNLQKRGDRHGMITHLLDGAHGGNSDNEYFILVAVSCMNVDSDMRNRKNKNNKTNSDYVKGYLKEMKFDGTTIVSINEASEGEAVGETRKGAAIVNIGGASEDKMRKGTAIYCLKLVEKKSKESNEEMGSEEKQKKETKDGYVLSENVDCFFSDSVSGICKFVDVTDKSENNVEQERFIILNFHGIFNFEFNDPNEFKNFTSTAQDIIRINLNEKFEYPKSTRRELDNWYTNTEDDCMRRLRSCIYDKYFLVTQYKNDAQLLEVYNLAKMELEVTAKKVENKDNFVRQYNYDTFSISRLQLCFTRGINHVWLYYTENGLQIASRKFDEIEKIHLLEFIDSDEKILIIGKDSEEKLKFIIWDLYNTDKIISIILNDYPINDIDTCLARTSENILHVDDKGNVTSVLKRIENKLKEQPKLLECDAEPIENSDKYKHMMIYYNKDTPNFNKDKKVISTFRKIANEMEPWVLDNHETHSYCLYYNKEGTKIEFLQLIVGRSTIQIWHHFLDQPGKKDHLPNKGDPFLEYIWTNGISVDQERKETGLRIKNFKYRSNDANDESNDKGDYKLNYFSLEVYWYKRKHGKKDKKANQDRKTDKVIIAKEDEEIHKFEMEKVTNETSMYVKKRTMVIKWRDIIETFHPIRHACKALKNLNKRYIKKSLVDNYNIVHKHEEIITYIKHIVWRFAKYNPEQFSLLDIRYNFMKSLILGDCDHLIKLILFGDEGNNENGSRKEKEKKKREEFEIIRHIPRNKLWPGREFIKGDDLTFYRKENDLIDNEDIKPENDMELAIHHCEGRELKDTIMIAYLLEYYSEHATGYAGWMCTISKALPLLFKYNYADYIRKLFHKECFANQDHFSAQDPDEIIPEEYQQRRNHNITFRAFRPIVKLKSDQQDIIPKPFKDFKNMTSKFIENFDNILGKSSLALRVVPLPGFTISEISKKKAEYTPFRIILNILWFLFIPRWYRIKRNDKDKLSPFSRMVQFENNDDIYDNPAIEAVINFCWQKAKNYFLFVFIQFLIFAICFAIVSWEYLYRMNGNHLVVLIAIFYYLAFYQLITEILQLRYRPRQYIAEIFNIVDIISVALSVAMMSMMIKKLQLSDGFGSVDIISTELIIMMSFTAFFLCIKLMFYLRFIPKIGFYLYYSIIIFKTILPFFIFMIIMIFSFALSMFILLRDPNINTKDQTLSGNATNTLTNQTLHIALKSDFDPTSRVDNPFSSLYNAVVAAYFWINGNWIQRDEFDSWAVDLFTVLASVVLVIFVQNMLISYMGGMHKKADIKARQRLLRDRAKYIAEHEALYQIDFWHDPDPKYVYYFGQSKYFEDWLKITKDEQDPIYKDLERKSTFTKHIFKEEDYDEVSILVRKGNIKTEIKTDTIDKIENVKHDVIDVTDCLIEKFKDQKNEIENIEHIKNMIHTNIEYLIKKLNENNSK